VDEFNGRYEASGHLTNADTEKIDLDFFASLSDNQRIRASMILSGLMGYGFEPNGYWHDPEEHELLLEFSDEEYVVAISLINVGLSEEF
jgi:hypothetical protein